MILSGPIFMKARTKHIANSNKTSEAAEFSLKFGGFSIVRCRKNGLVIELPAEIAGLNWVAVNGVRFIAHGTVNEVVRVAPVKYGDDLFAEVNELQRTKYYSPTAAIREIADKYNLNHDSFRRQYYARGGHRLKNTNGGKRSSLEVKRPS
jgi:hypothetical protein